MCDETKGPVHKERGNHLRPFKCESVEISMYASQEINLDHFLLSFVPILVKLEMPSYSYDDLISLPNVMFNSLYYKYHIASANPCDVVAPASQPAHSLVHRASLNLQSANRQCIQNKKSKKTQPILSSSFKISYQQGYV